MASAWLRRLGGRLAGSGRAAAPRAGRRQVSLPFAAQGFVVLVCLALLALSVDHVWRERDGRLQEAQDTNANLARSLVQHAEDTFGIADAALVGLADRFERDGDWPEALAGIERQMLAQTAGSPRISGLFLYGADGGWLASSVPSSPGANNADRDYFRHHRDSTDRGPYLGRPVRSRSRGTWIATVSRRLEHADGRFAGVVLATVGAEYFAVHYGGFDLGPKGTIALFRAEGALLSRNPFDAAQMERSFASLPFFREQLPQSSSGSYRFVSPIDGVEKVAGYHSGRSFPVVVIVASAVEDVLRGWAIDSAGRLAGIGVAVALLAWIGTRLVRQVRGRQEAEAALGVSELHFRLLTEMSGDMVTRVGLDGVRHYVSPASTELLGWTPEELLGTRALTAVHPEDREAARQELAGLAAGEARAGTVAYRTRHRDGREVWLESSVRITRDAATNAPSGAVVISRDITGRKALEAQLARLAMTDGLTGLANRRRLDEALVAEWRRAAREGTALSVALMDVDRFKAFNDRNGHGAGDACLRGVAAALATVTRRPADLVARYGGEEMAALLPCTGAQGAAEVAEAFRAAVEALAIAHPDSRPGGVVTVSVGVASVTPMPAEDPAGGIGALLAAADAALYRAKDAGRNRVCAAPVEVPPGGGRVAGRPDRALLGT